MSEKVTKKELETGLNRLRSFALHASPYLFNEIFGEDMGPKYWDTYINRCEQNPVNFWGYLDEAYKEVLLTALLPEKWWLHTTEVKQA